MAYTEFNGELDDEVPGYVEFKGELDKPESTMDKVKSTGSKAIDAGLSLLTPKKSIADRTQERSASTAGLAAPQVKGVPVRQDFYNRMVAETPAGSTTPGTGIIARTRNAAAQDTDAQKGKRVVAKALVSPEPVPEEGGFINSAGRTIGQNIKGAGQIAADFIPGVAQDNAVKRYGQAVIDANPTAVNSLEDIANEPGTAVAEATGNAAPSMAGMVGARAVGQGITALSPLAGPAAPLVAAAGQVVSWLGPAAIASLPSYGGIRDKQILNDPKNEKDAKAIAIATMGAAAVGAIEQAFGPQQWALAALTKEGRAQLAEKFAATTLPGAIGKGIAKGAAIEGSEELAQNPIEQLASFDNPMTPENLKETAFGGAMGAIGGGVLGGGTGALARQNPTPTILGKPVTEVSNGVLQYTASRGSRRAKETAQAELDRRAAQGVDPAVANQPESTTEAVERIISTGRDKAQEIKDNAASEPDAIQSGIFDEPGHIVDVNNMVDEGTGGAVTDNPTPEPIETLNAQLNALAEGRKPGVLLTPGEPLPATLPPDVRVAMVPNRGMLLYRDDATLQAALNGQMGTALGYGIDEKPGDATHVVTARDQNGTVIQDVATNGNPKVQQAAAAVAGSGGTVEVRPVQEAMGERHGSGVATLDPDEEFRKAAEKRDQENREWAAKLSQMTYDELNASHEKAIAHNDAVDLEAVQKFLGSDVAAQFKDWGRRKRDNWWNENATTEMQDFANERHVPEDLISDFRSEVNNFDTDSPRALGRSIALISRNIDAPGFFQTPEGARFRNAMQYASDQGWSLDDVVKGMQSRGAEWAGDDARELFPRLFTKKKNDKVKTGPAVSANQEPTPAPSPSIEDKSRATQSPAGNDSAPNEVPGVHPIRPFVESLIKRRAAAKETGKERSLNNAIARAKEVMEGKRTDTDLESKWFRVQAAGMKKADPDTAEILKKIGEVVEAQNALNTQFGRTSFERFAALGDEIGTAEQALADAEEITGLRLGLPIVFVKLAPNNPARFIPGSRTIEVARDWKFNRDEGAQYIAEELLHAVDSLSANYTLSASSKRLDLKTGDIAQEVINHQNKKGVYNDFFRYPMLENDLSDSVKKAELFARLGVLYFGEPERMRQSLPLAYGAFNGIFKLSIHPVSGEISRSVWSFSRRSSPLVREHGADKQDGSGNGSSSQDGQRTELERLREAIRVSFEARKYGAKVDFTRLDTRSFKTRLNAYKEKQRAGAEADRIASVRQRLKAAEDRAKQATHSGGLSVSEVEKHIAPLQKQGFKKINVAATEADLPQSIQDSIKSRKAGAVRGVYLPSTDEIWLVADKLNDGFEAATVALHEARHRGLRKLFGPDISPILRQIYLTNKRVRAAADTYMKSMSLSKEEAIEEVLADMSIDRARALNGWKKLVNFIKQWIAERFNLAFTDEMVETLVAGAEVVGTSENEVSLFDDRRARDYAETSKDASTPMFSRSGQNNPNPQANQSGNNASWGAPEPSMMDDLIYKLQNKHVDLKRVVEAVKATGAQIADKWNAYLQEELFHGRAAKRVQDFVNKELKPIIQGMKLRGLTVDELDQYLHARHAEEANKLIAQRDPNMPDGGSGMSTKDAKAYLSGLPADQKQRLENVAKMVDAVIAKTGDLYVSYGLIDQATADSWKNMFQHYVPLMREDHDGGMGIGQGFSIKGKEVKHRTGSKRRVVDILANIALQRERAIVRGEKNRVAVSLAGLAKLNPNTDFWTFDKVPTEKVLNEATNQVEERPVPNFKDRKNVVVAKIKDSSGKIIERAVVFNEEGEHKERALRMAQALKNLDADQLGGLLGVSAAITRYFAAINTQYNPVFGIVNLTRDLQGSLLNLSSTPIAGHKAEVLKNVMPAIHAIYSSTRGDRKGKQATSPMAALWDEMQQEGGMTGYRDLFRTSEDRANAIKHELDPTAWMNSGLGKIFTAGGMLKVPLAVAQKRAKWLFDWLSDYNQTLEGAMRLSVYKTAIDNGSASSGPPASPRISQSTLTGRGSPGSKPGPCTPSSMRPCREPRG
jgi:hypothetical protein